MMSQNNTNINDFKIKSAKNESIQKPQPSENIPTQRNPLLATAIANSKERWKHIRMVFSCHLHDKTLSWLSATLKHLYYLHDAGENKEDTQLNKVLNENLLENITPWNSPTIVRAT